MIRILLFLTLTSCQFTSYYNFTSRPFKATEREFFPDFLEILFPKSQVFVKEYNLSRAKQGFKLVEVKRFTHLDQKINEENLSWSGDGRFLAYEFVEDGQRRIVVQNIVNGKKHLLDKSYSSEAIESSLSFGTRSFNSSLKWSFDSERVAFMASDNSGSFNIYSGLVGGKEHVVAKHSLKDGQPSWSPNSNELVFVSSRTGGGDIYFARDGDSSNERLTFSKESDLFPEWGADGNSVFFSSGSSNNHDLMVVVRKDAKWLKPQRVTIWDQDDLRPKPSPDGKYLSFYANSPYDEMVWNLHVISYEENKIYNKQDLLSSIVAENIVVDMSVGPSWTPDSKKIFFVKKNPKLFNPICVFDIESKGTYRLNTGTRINRDVRISSLGVLSFRAQVGAWDKIFIALTNQGRQFLVTSES